MAGRRARPEKTALILARRVVADIGRRELGVGDRLPSEREMLEDYQVGRGTLREALRFLELQRVISLKPGPGGGPTVEKPDASTLATTMLLLLQFDRVPYSSIVQTRRDLEPLMARLAAEHMTAEELEQLSGSVDDMRAGLDDRAAFRRADRQFHHIVAWGTHNSIYGFLIDAVLDILGGVPLEADPPESLREATLRSHIAILEGLKAHDGDSSSEAMVRLMRDYMKYVTGNFPDVLAREVAWTLS